MESEASWAMLALALGLVLALTAVVVWLSVTEVRAVRPAPATVRPGRDRARGLRQGAAAEADRFETRTDTDSGDERGTERGGTDDERGA